MAVILKSANLSVSPDDAWDIVDRFMRADIRVFSFIRENRIEGPVRTVVSEGLEQPELNITIDPEHMYASYTLLESPLESHLSPRVHAGLPHRRRSLPLRVDHRLRSGFLGNELKGEYMDVLWSELVKVIQTGEEAPPPPAVPAD